MLVVSSSDVFYVIRKWFFVNENTTPNCISFFNVRSIEIRSEEREREREVIYFDHAKRERGREREVNYLEERKKKERGKLLFGEGELARDATIERNLLYLPLAREKVICCKRGTRFYLKRRPTSI